MISNQLFLGTSATSPQFFSDAEVARLFCMSRSWVQGQRFKRRDGLEHVLDIDPCMIGSAVRYRRADVEALAALISGRAGFVSDNQKNTRRAL